MSLVNLLSQMSGCMTPRVVARPAVEREVRKVKAEAIEARIAKRVGVDFTVRDVMMRFDVSNSYVSKVLAPLIAAGKVRVRVAPAGVRKAVYRVVHIPD